MTNFDFQPYYDFVNSSTNRLASFRHWVKQRERGSAVAEFASQHPVFTTKEVCEQIHISPETLYRRVRALGLPKRGFGQRRFTQHELELIRDFHNKP